jgi:V-type H+-transporting ATPase subunit H
MWLSFTAALTDSFYQTLIKLANSRDEEIAAIACFDIGEFVRHYPNGKHIARRLGAREVVMALIEHEDMEVQRQALLCISKMLVQNWQAIGCTFRETEKHSL